MEKNARTDSVLMPRLFEIVQYAEEDGLFLGKITVPLLFLQKAHGDLEMRRQERNHSGRHHFKGLDLELLFNDLSVEEEDENEGGCVGVGRIRGARDTARDHCQRSSKRDDNVLCFDEGVEELSEGLPPRVVAFVLKLWGDFGSTEGNGVAEHQSGDESDSLRTTVDHSHYPRKSSE